MYRKYIFNEGSSSVAREHRRVGDTGPGITEVLIRDLVGAFYRHARADAELGPIFERALAGRWESHLSKMCDFWSSVMLKTARYSGRPVPAHLRLDALQPRHFDLWLDFFRRTARETCPSRAAAAFIDRSDRIAESLRRSLIANRAVKGLPDEAPARTGEQFAAIVGGPR